MYGLEYSEFIINLLLGILIPIYICFRRYIFIHDVVYKDLSSIDPYSNDIMKLYPNGASRKNLGDEILLQYMRKINRMKHNMSNIKI